MEETFPNLITGGIPGTEAQVHIRIHLVALRLKYTSSASATCRRNFVATSAQSIAQPIAQPIGA